MSSVSVSLEPAEFSNWQEARTALMAEAKAGLKAKLEAELASMSDEGQLEELRESFSKEERSLEHTMDHQVHTFSAILDLEYKYVALIQTLLLEELFNCFLTLSLVCAQLPLQVDAHLHSVAQQKQLCPSLDTIR